LTTLLKSTRRQGVAFLTVGCATALLDYLTLYALTRYAGLGYFASAGIGFLVGSIANYLLSIRWVFVPGKYRQPVEFTAFILTSAAGLALNQLIMWLSVDGLGVYYLYAKLLAIAVVTAWNFASKKLLVFAG
jgi:putative flippase GtrA